MKFCFDPAVHILNRQVGQLGALDMAARFPEIFKYCQKECLLTMINILDKTDTNFHLYKLAFDLVLLTLVIYLMIQSNCLINVNIFNFNALKYSKCTFVFRLGVTCTARPRALRMLSSNVECCRGIMLRSITRKDIFISW